MKEFNKVFTLDFTYNDKDMVVSFQWEADHLGEWVEPLGGRYMNNKHLKDELLNDDDFQQALTNYINNPEYDY
tara:strand:+ start:684 stop:902 length:219 start_codon:yes stop_codon:yes gene_type:complete